METTTERLEQIRKDLNLSMEEFSKSVGISWYTYRNALRAKRNLTIDILINFLKAYPNKERYILYGESKHEPKSVYNSENIKIRYIPNLQAAAGPLCPGYTS